MTQETSPTEAAYARGTHPGRASGPVWRRSRRRLAGGLAQRLAGGGDAAAPHLAGALIQAPLPGYVFQQDQLSFHVDHHDDRV